MTIAIAAELNAAEMVNLPLRVITRHPSQRDAVLADALTLRGDLERLAAAETQAMGEYLRPILLIQVSRNSSHHSWRELLASAQRGL